MKIVNRKTFLHLPAGTVFSKYEFGAFDDFCIKGATHAGIDFSYQPIAGAIRHNDSDGRHDSLCEGEGTGDSIPMDFECEHRDGLFDKGQMFAVWEPEDVEALIARLQSALKTSTAT